MSRPKTPGPYSVLNEGTAPAPLITLIVTAANLGFLAAFVETHTSWKGPGWLLVVLFPLFGAVIPMIYQTLILRQGQFRALRMAWNELEADFEDHLRSVIRWYRETARETGQAPGFSELEAAYLEPARNLDEALKCYPVVVRYQLHRDLHTLNPPVVLWAHLQQGDPAKYVPNQEETVFVDLHLVFTRRIRPDLTHAIILLAIGNVVGWWAMW